MLNELTLNRRRWLQTVGGGVASAVASSFAAEAAAVGPIASSAHDSVAAAIVQSRARTEDDLRRELAEVLLHSRKHLICFPALEPDLSAAAVQAMAAQARAASVYVAVNDRLMTPAGEILSGQSLYRTSMGTIAFVPTLFKPVQIEGADILLHLSAQPVSFTRAQTLAAEHGAHLVAATPVGDAFLQATGSVIFSPAGDVLAAAGAAWTQTLTATLRVAHWRDAKVRGYKAREAKAQV